MASRSSKHLQSEQTHSENDVDEDEDERNEQRKKTHDFKC